MPFAITHMPGEPILVLGGPAPFLARDIEKLAGIQTSAVPQWNVACTEIPQF